MWKRRLEIKGEVRSITWEHFGTIPIGVNALNITWGKGYIFSKIFKPNYSSNYLFLCFIAAFGSYMFVRNESHVAFYAPHHISYKVIGKTTCIQVASNKVLLSRGSNFVKKEGKYTFFLSYF